MSPGPIASARGFTMRLVEKASREQWDRLVFDSPGGGHALQSYTWGEFKREQGWEPFQLVLERDGEIRDARYDLNFADAIAMDLSRSEEELMAEMSEKTTGEQSSEGLGVDTPSIQCGVETAPATTMRCLEAQVNGRRDSGICRKYRVGELE